MSTHNLCFEQKNEKYQNFLFKKFPFLVVKFSIFLNRCVFVMVVRLKKKMHPWLFKIRSAKIFIRLCE